MTASGCSVDINAGPGFGRLPDDAGRDADQPPPFRFRLGPGHRVLVAEEDGLAALAMADTLTALGAERIELCSRADDALELIAQLRPTVLILDLGLVGGSDGLTVAELAREIVNTPPAIILATDAPALVPRHIARRSQVLPRPFTQQALADAVVRAATRRRLLGRLWQYLAG